MLLSISKCDICHCQKVKQGGVLNPSDDIDDDHKMTAEYNNSINTLRWVLIMILMMTRRIFKDLCELVLI